MDIVPPDDSLSNPHPKTTFIYCLRDPETNEIRYIGKADNLKHRFQVHMSDRRDTYKRRWINALQERGLKPLMDILEEVPYEIWEEREIYWIDFYRSQGCHLTNTATGGSGGGEFPPEVRAKISAKRMGIKHKPTSEEGRRNMGLAHLGKKHTPESRHKMSEGRKNIIFSEEHIRHISESHKGKPGSMKGKKHTPEARKKMSIAKRKPRGPMPEAQKRKISEAQIGKVVSDETRKRLSESHKGKTSPNKGKKRSPESRSNMSLGKQRAKAMRQNSPNQPTLWD